jgi:hypothetical protein
MLRELSFAMVFVALWFLFIVQLYVGRAIFLPGYQLGRIYGLPRQERPVVYWVFMMLWMVLIAGATEIARKTVLGML